MPKFELAGAQERLRDVQASLVDGQRALRHLISGLKSAPPSDVGLDARLKNLCQRLERQWGLQVERNVTGLDSLPSHLWSDVYLRMPGKNGLEVLRALKAEKARTRAVLLVAALDDEELLEATRLGVGGVVLKEMAPRLLVQCIRKVHAGEPWIERTSAARAFEKLLRREAGARDIARLLTAREIEIAKMVGRGLRNKAIGEALHISEGTVKTHLHTIFEKLNIGSRAELIVYCQDKGIV